MEKLKIISIDDQREILAALRKDLLQLGEYCSLAECESAEEAAEVLDEVDAEGAHLAILICDHVMPGQNGIDFLAEFDKDVRFPHTKRVLLTGLATHQDTIVAINEAHIDFYIEKPWDGEDLLRIIKVMLTRYVLESGLEYRPYLAILDQETLYEKLGGEV